MISKQDLERILAREGNDRPVLSLFLDMSVNSDNKRTYGVFLNRKRAELEELDGHRSRASAEELAEVFARVDRWIDDGFVEANRGVVIYAEVGGDGFEALQFPVPVQNRLVLAERPVIGPLAQVIESYHHYGVVLLDREHVRILSVYLGSLLDEIEVRGEPLPARHDVHAGGYSQERYQRRKLEETKHFFREFAREVEEFVRRYRPQELVILGTDANVAQFREYLPDPVLEKVVHTGHAEVDGSAGEIIARLQPHLRDAEERFNRTLVEQLRDRVAQDYLATAGYQGTLSALQEGKVDTLVLARDGSREGVRCPKCGYVFARDMETCPFDGSETRPGVDVVEEMVRIAEGQGITVAFAEPGDVQELRGAGALLRY